MSGQVGGETSAKGELTRYMNQINLYMEVLELETYSNWIFWEAI